MLQVGIRAADYRFSDKVKYYKGFTNDKGQYKSGTIISELIKIATDKNDFTEQDIVDRAEEITSEFINFLKLNKLIKEN